MKKFTLYLIVLLFSSSTLYAQVAINKDASAPISGSILHVKGDATDKDVIIEPGTGGKVGIGTTMPNARFVVHDFFVDFKIAPGNLDGAPNTEWVTLDINDTKNLRIWDNLSVSGNVGIGTTNIVDKLDVHGNYGWHAPHNFHMRGTGEFSFDFSDSDGEDYWQVWAPTIHSILVARNNGKVGVGTSNPQSKLQVAGGVQVGDDSEVASANKVGTIRYRSDSNNSYAEMCMQTGESTYEWVVIQTNHWE